MKALAEALVMKQAKEVLEDAIRERFADTSQQPLLERLARVTTYEEACVLYADIFPEERPTTKKEVEA